jgi:hypothetical protein
MSEVADSSGAAESKLERQTSSLNSVQKDFTKMSIAKALDKGPAE